MTQDERDKLNKEWSDLQEKVKGEFVDPRDMRRIDQITSLLMTDGESDSVKFKFVKGRGGNKGLNATKPYYRKGKVG